MTEMEMPQTGGDGETGVGCCRAGGWRNGVKIAGAIAAKNLASGRKILDRETKNVKLYGAVIILSKLTNGNQITD